MHLQQLLVQASSDIQQQTFHLGKASDFLSFDFSEASELPVVAQAWKKPFRLQGRVRFLIHDCSAAAIPKRFAMQWRGVADCAGSMQAIARNHGALLILASQLIAMQWRGVADCADGMQAIARTHGAFLILACPLIAMQ